MGSRSAVDLLVDDVLRELEGEFEAESFAEKDIGYAVLANRRYKVMLGWDRYEQDIGRLLGFANSSPTEALFSQSVAEWQAQNGLRPVDGMVGPVTWARMRSALGLPSGTSPAAAGGLSAPPSKTLTWPQIILLLNKYRGDIPLYFLMGWIDVESGRQLEGPTSLGELGYFQIHPGESKELGLDHPRLRTDPDYSIWGGIQLVRKRAAQAHSLGFPEGTELLWRVTKWRHWAPGGVDVILKDMAGNGVKPVSWDAIEQYVIANRVRIGALMDARFPIRGKHWDPMFGINNVDKTIQRGKQLAATFGIV
jgi:hypothetical protein